METPLPISVSRWCETKLIQATLEISPPTELPVIGLTWSLEEKYRAIAIWVEQNFSDDSALEFELPDGNEPSNLIDIQSDFDFEGERSSDLVKRYFSEILLMNEFEIVSKRLDGLNSGEWFPTEHRVSVEREIFDETLIEFDEIKEEIPKLRETLIEVREVLEAMRGHNAAPDEVLGLDKIKEIDAGLARLEDLELGEDDSSWVESFADSLKEFGRDFGAHIVEMAKVGSLKFAESFGEKAGAAVANWPIRLTAFALLGERLAAIFY